MFQESQSSQRFRPETERRKRVTGSRPPKAPGNLVGSESTKDRDQNTFLSSPRRIPNPFPGCAQRVALLTQPRPTAARRFLAAAGAPRSLSRRPAGGEGGLRPVGGAPAQAPRLPPPTRKRLRRGEPRASALRGGPQGGRREEGARVAAGGSRRPWPPGSPRGAWGASSRDRARARRPASCCPEKPRRDAPRTPSCREDDHGRGQERTGGPAEHVSGEYCPAVQW